MPLEMTDRAFKPTSLKIFCRRLVSRYVVLVSAALVVGCATQDVSPRTSDEHGRIARSIAPAPTPIGSATAAAQIVGIEVSQAVQQPNDYLPLVAHRDAFVRIYVVGSNPNQTPPSVQLSVFSNGALAGQYAVSPIAFLPTTTDMSALESNLQNSYNLLVPGNAIGDGLSMSAALMDAPGTPSYGSYIASGDLETFEQAPLVLDLYPVNLSYVDSSTGILTTIGVGNSSTIDPSYLAQVIPASSVNVNAHQSSMSVDASQLYADFEAGASATTLQSDRSMLSLRILRDLATLPGQHQVGILPASAMLGALTGDAQIADMIQNQDGSQELLGLPSMFSVSGSLSTVAAARGIGSVYAVNAETNDPILNSTTCSPVFTNPDPYSSGSVQDIGIDLRSKTVISPDLPSIMSDCTDTSSPANWASDHFWETLDYNLSASASWPQVGSGMETLEVAGQLSPSLTVGVPRLVSTAATTPNSHFAPARHRVSETRSLARRLGSAVVLPVATPTSASATLTGYSGLAQVFSVPVVALASLTGESSFAADVPISEAAASGLTSLTLSYGGSKVTALSKATAPTATAISLPSGLVQINWNAASYPTIYVHGENGSVTEIDAPRAVGDVQFASSDSNLNIEFCDGVKSVYSTVPVSRSP